MPPLVIGDRADPHADAVCQRLETIGAAPVVLDAASLQAGGWRWVNGTVEAHVQDRWVRPKRGWLRRLAPPDWHRGVTLGSLAAAEASAQLSLLAALSSTPVEWLTSYWDTLRAENKLVQYRAALACGIPTPETAVTSHVDDLPDGLGDPFVVKPLGAGDFASDGAAYAVHAQLVAREDARLETLSGAPFILQAHVPAVAHLRIVTVRDRAWTSRLNADCLPLDWRAEPDAHAMWKICRRSEGVERAALHLASAVGVGYSSQDWIVDACGAHWFVDLNPAGQWLFLPEPTAEEVTVAIANWLGAP